MAQEAERASVAYAIKALDRKNVEVSSMGH